MSIPLSGPGKHKAPQTNFSFRHVTRETKFAFHVNGNHFWVGTLIDGYVGIDIDVVNLFQAIIFVTNPVTDFTLSRYKFFEIDLAKFPNARGLEGVHDDRIPGGERNPAGMYEMLHEGQQKSRKDKHCDDNLDHGETSRLFLP